MFWGSAEVSDLLVQDIECKGDVSINGDREVKITVFTPAFNRAATLPRLYKSLLRQKEYLHEWLVVDDGSTDNTNLLISSYIDEGAINIRYLKKENGGMLSAHNVAYDNISSGLCMCIDSDDMLAEGALKIVHDLSEEVYSRPELAGMVGLDRDLQGRVLGDSFPEGLKYTTFKEIRFSLRLKGDKKYIYKKEVVEQYEKFPEIAGERYPAASYLYRLIDNDYKLLVVPHPLCDVEYQADGNSNNKFKQYMANPLSFKHYRMVCMDDAFGFKEKFVSAIHFVSSCVFAKQYGEIIFNKYFWLTLPVAPFGMLLAAYIKHTRRTGVIKIHKGGL